MLALSHGIDPEFHGRCEILFTTERAGNRPGAGFPRPSTGRGGTLVGCVTHTREFHSQSTGSRQAATPAAADAGRDGTDALGLHFALAQFFVLLPPGSGMTQ